MKQLKNRLKELAKRSDEHDRLFRKIKLEDSPTVGRLFSLGGLDTDEIGHQRVVLQIVADLTFPPKRKKGATRWTSERLHQLLEDFAALEQRKKPYRFQGYAHCCLNKANTTARAKRCDERWLG